MIDYTAKIGTQTEVDKVQWLIEAAQVYRAQHGQKSLRKLIIHCSASTFGDAMQIDDWHRNGRLFDMIGYNFVILNGLRRKNSVYDANEDGSIEAGRPLTRAGAHTSQHNDDSVGVCLIGTHDSVASSPSLVFTSPQIDTLQDILFAWKDVTGLELSSSVFGHNDFDKGKLCPCFSVASYLRTIT